MRIVMPTCPCPQPLPAFVNTILMAYWTFILDWCSQQIYAHLIHRDSQHLLVRLQTRLKFTAVEAACAAFHHADGAGAPPTHPTAQLARALLVGHLYDWSLRQLEWQIRYNLVVKWFVGYPIFADGPDHATLERFELWVAEHQPRAIFDDVLRQIDAIFPHERARDQVGDTYALRADAAKESLVHLIRHACRRLLTVLHSADVERHACVIAALDRTALFGAPNEHRDWYLTDAQHAARVQTTVLAALDCTRLVRAQLAVVPPLPNDLTGPILDWLDRVDKIIADEVILAFPESQAISAPLTAPSTTPVDAALTSSLETPSALSPPTVSATAPPTVTERPAPVKGAYRIGSATDPDATYRVHTHTRQAGKTAGKTDLGYNVSVLVSADAIDPVDSDALGGAFIREVHVDTGAQPDAVALPDLLVSQRQFHDLIPSKVIYDTAAGSGKTRHLVALATDLRTQLVARLSAPLGRRTTDFGPEHFTLSANGAALTCPHGLTTYIAYRSGSGDGRDFRFLGSSCVDCPLWSQCRTQPVGSRAMRQVFISDYRDQITAARAYNATLPFKQDMKHRAVVERVIAALVRYNGARHARRRGLTFADFQVRMNATAYNLKRWMRLLALRELAAKKPAST